MKKPNQLRQVLQQSHDFFVKNPDNLQIFVEDGKIINTGTENLSFEYKYKLNLIVTDYPDDITKIVLPVMAYLKINQPELFANPTLRDNAILFTPDFNNNNTADLHFEIGPMTEMVVVTHKEANEVTLDYAPEPVWQKERVKVYLENENQLIFDSDNLQGNECNGNR